MLLAEEADQNALPEEMDIPDELKRRKDRLAVIERAKKEIQARAQKRFKREQTEYEEKVDRRKAYEDETGKKARGRKPTAPTQEPLAKDQVNLTDEESRIMPSSSGGFEQGYNAQAGVDVETHLIVEQHVTQHTNDKQEIETALERITTLPEVLGKVDCLLADTGYFSETNVDRCTGANIEPLIPKKRQAHNLPLKERFKDDPEPPQNPNPVQTMKHRMQTQEGKALYAKRKSTVETVFGIIKHVLEFRQFLLRGFDSVQSEWSLVCIGWNIKRMHALKG